jgi:imidazolonepropionase-like amidohydrolase
MMQHAGVGLLAGTDLPANASNGTIHDELAYLVEAGLTPMQALVSATANPAKFFGKLSTLGTVEPGKFADLVLLDSNPLDDIHNTRRIASVIVKGRIVFQTNKSVQ